LGSGQARAKATSKETEAGEAAPFKTGLTHVDRSGTLHMVDVGGKAATRRLAIAMSRITLSAAAFAATCDNALAKGDVLTVAKIAGIQAAKRCAELIPLCHTLSLSSAQVHIAPDASRPHTFLLLACARTAGQTGVEMEALTAASVASLTVYDMTKALSKASVIGDTRLLLKLGGKSGRFEADVEPEVLAAVPADWLEEYDL